MRHRQFAAVAAATAAPRMPLALVKGDVLHGFEVVRTARGELEMWLISAK